MGKFKVYLTGGKSTVLKARTATQAKYKYYGSASHFGSERSVIKVRKYKKGMT